MQECHYFQAVCGFLPAPEKSAAIGLALQREDSVYMGQEAGALIRKQNY